MPNYRLYFMTSSGHIKSVHEYEADDDASAISEGERVREVDPMELWCSARKVKRWDSILDRRST